MKTVRRGPTLFEAMSRAPVASGGNRRRAGLAAIFGGRNSAATSRPVVAEPLTEEQVLEEIAARQAEAERQRREAEERRAQKQARQEERKAQRAQRQAAKAAARAEAAERKKAMAAGGESPRLTISLGTSAIVGIAGVLAALVLAAFSIGRQTKDQSSKVSTVAAVTTPPAAQPAPAPAFKSPPVKTPPPAPKIIVPRPQPTTTPPVSPDVAELLKKPEPKAERMIAANKPASVVSQETAADSLPQDMNYLQIETFGVTRERNGEQLAADLAHVRAFLLERGVRTFARKRPNGGYVLFCEQGVRPGKEHTAEREALKKKLQQLGGEYRAAGGLYQFKGCLFVSYASTRLGDPG